MRKQVAHHRAAFATGLELPAGLEQHALLIGKSAAGAGLFAIGLKQLGFRIEGVHVRHAAIREDEDDALRLRRKMRLLRRKWIDLALGEQFRQQAGHEQRSAHQGAQDFAAGLKRGVHGLVEVNEFVEAQQHAHIGVPSFVGVRRAAFGIGDKLRRRRCFIRRRRTSEQQFVGGFHAL